MGRPAALLCLPCRWERFLGLSGSGAGGPGGKLRFGAVRPGALGGRGGAVPRGLRLRRRGTRLPGNTPSPSSRPRGLAGLPARAGQRPHLAAQEPQMGR